jgi:hypothetical protein
MLRNIFVLWIVYAALMGFAVGGSFVSAFPPPQPLEKSCSEGNQTAANCETSEKQHEAAEIALGNYTKWLVIVTAGLAAATFLMGIATIGLYNSGRDQIALSRAEFVSTHRPKVIVRQFQLDAPSVGQPLRVMCSAINCGDTNASIDGLVGELALWNVAGCYYEQPGINPLVEQVTRVLRNGERMTFTYISRFPLTNIQWNEIQQRSYLLRCVGEITYADDLGTKRRTGFHRTYDVGQDRFIPSTDPDQEYSD